MWLIHKTIFTNKECCLLFGEGKGRDMKFCAHQESIWQGWDICLAVCIFSLITRCKWARALWMVWKCASYWKFYGNNAVQWTIAWAKVNILSVQLMEEIGLLITDLAPLSMRLVALKAIGGCSYVRVLQHLKKLSRGICIGIPLMCKSLFSVRKEFLGQLPKPLYYSCLHIIIGCVCAAFEGLLNWSKDVKIVCVKSGLYVGYWSISCISVAFTSSWSLWAGGALSRSRMRPSLSLSRCLFLCQCATFGVCDCNCTECVLDDLKSRSRGLSLSLCPCSDGLPRGVPS
jgi:hypothetical protein